MGLVLPPGVVQPFEILFSRDDLHVIVYLADHPAYEAVEAMIRLGSGPPRVRAIITRRDQTQIDHVSDPQLAATSWARARETVERSFALERSDDGGRPRVRVAFASFAGETIELAFAALGPPARDRGGLTDPGDHAATVSLPLMRRLASTLAAPGTAVVIDGHRHAAPEWRRLGPAVVAHHGFLSDGHPMGVVRAADVRWVLRDAPSRFAPGEIWRYDTSFGERCYRIADLRGDGALAIRRDGPMPEHVLATPRGDQLELHRVRVADGADDAGGFAIELAGGLAEGSADGRAQGRVALGIDAETELVTGSYTVERDGEFVIQPGAPDWAARRPLRVQIATTGNAARITTRIG
jgi:hypothetical protein